MNWSKFIHPRNRELIFISFALLSVGVDFIFRQADLALWLVSIIGSIPTILSAVTSLRAKRISIDVFNTFALAASFVSGEIRSAAFIVLMLSFARLLDWYTESRTHRAIEELLRLKPSVALKDINGVITEVPITAIKSNDTIVVNLGSRVPVDGVVIYGTASMNEAPLTGETALVEKVIGDTVYSSTLVEAGSLKFRATNVGKDSTIDRMVALVESASRHKARSEKIADKFAQIFLPIVGLLGLGTYLVTKNLTMVAALFLVACADDMAVAIPLAITAALGNAARRGVIVKGGEWLDALAKVRTVVFDKTGTLTYGQLSIRNVEREASIEENKFWRLVAIAEKFSEHPVGKAVFRFAARQLDEVPDPDKFESYKGAGVSAVIGRDTIIIGNEGILAYVKSDINEEVRVKLAAKKLEHRQTAMAVILNNQLLGVITVADTARPEARASITALTALGVEQIIMFTGDNAEVAADVAKDLGITDWRALMKPEDKLRELEQLEIKTRVAMVGDGINDAPSLARADVGIAMGSGGTGVAVEAADIVILTDDLARLPEIILLGRKTLSVIRGDMVIWILSNLFGFALVFTGFAGPALAAFYNFATDFLPLFNSTRLFRRGRQK